ncbi:ras-related protein Rab-24 isoform X1 [Sapajus apella]|uniref:Ras-related protein Rab-24 n=1 Tax=Sapajus apella TaxID=9515 RepID=A0A6J3H6K0_SAPAP|nr:ras-related protein Rab-24 isoform X1 [Sapajus apella]
MSGQRVDVKVVMLGKEYVGKTSLVERYVHDRFLVGPYQNTIGAAFVAKVMSVGDRTVTLGIWDTAGSERYEAMSRIYYRGAKAAIVCYDLTDSSSFERAKFWVKELRSLEEGCQIYLCGTKSDLLEEDRRRRRVDFHDVQDYADNIKAQLFETSSKTGQSVDELFQKVAEDYVSVAAFQRTRAWTWARRQTPTFTAVVITDSPLTWPGRVKGVPQSGWTQLLTGLG